MMLSVSVTAKSVSPTANSERYLGSPYDASPPITWTMYVVIVSIEVSGFSVI